MDREIDFDAIGRVDAWLAMNWDLGFIYREDDEEAARVLREIGTKRFELPKDPTVSSLAFYLARTVCPVVMEGADVLVSKVTLWEGDDRFAEAIP